jgi:cysteinyl-tRNA synthetase
VVDLLKQHHPETVRFLLLGTHYRSPIEYSEERLQEVKRSLEGFYRFFERYERITGASFYKLEVPWSRADGFNANWTAGSDWDEIVRLRAAFLACMDDDFNTGGAIGILYELLTSLNRFADAKQLEGAGATAKPAAEVFRKSTAVLRELGQLLGLFHDPVTAAKGGDDKLVGGLIQLLIDLRAEARKAKDFALGDQIRNRLTQLGITLEDRAGGTGWRIG